MSVIDTSFEMRKTLTIKYIYLLLLTFVISGINSCECVPDINTPKEIKPDQYSNVMFINSNPDFDLLKFATEAGNFSADVYYLAEDYDYQSIIPGIVNIQILAGKDSLLFNSVMDLKRAFPYTFFAFGTSDRMQGFVLTDTIDNYASNNSYFRCINLANYSPYIMFKIIGTYSIPTIRPYKTASNFFPTYSGVYNVEIRNAMTDSVLLYEKNIEFKPGYAYSLLLRGYYKGMGHQKMNLKVIESDFLLKREQEEKKF